MDGRSSFRLGPLSEISGESGEAFMLFHLRVCPRVREMCVSAGRSGCWPVWPRALLLTWPSWCGWIRRSTTATPVRAALGGGAAVSLTTRWNTGVKAGIASTPDDEWTTIEYTDGVIEEPFGAVDLSGRRWRDRVHCFRAPSNGSGARSVDRAPHPPASGLRESSCRAGRAVRRVAFPRVLHHHRSGGPRSFELFDQIWRHPAWDDRALR